MNNRRDFLKTSLMGLGALAYSPYLSAKPAAQSIPKRFVFIRKGNGIMPGKYNLPTLAENQKETKDLMKGVAPFEVDLDKHELPAWLQSLNEYKEHMSIIIGMSGKMCRIGHASYASIMMASGGGQDTSSLIRTSIDFELAKLYPSTLGHVELSFAQNRKGVVDGYSVPKPYKKNFCYADPITAYNKLFKSVLSPKTVEQENSTLEYLRSDQSTAAKIKKGKRKEGYEDYIRAIESVRNRNLNMLKMSDQIAKNLPDRKKIYKYGSSSASLVQKQEAMTDILVSALVTGMTNVVTYTIDDLPVAYTGLPGLENDLVDLHAVGHHKSIGAFDAETIREIIRKQHINQIKTIIDGLKAQPEGNGNMFDNTMIMYFPEAGDGHHGLGQKPPMFVMSGKNCNLDIAGRFVRLPHYKEKGHQTIGNWYTTLLNAHGNHIKHYGSLDSGLKLPQEGNIKQFMKKS